LGERRRRTRRRKGRHGQPLTSRNRSVVRIGVKGRLRDRPHDAIFAAEFADTRLKAATNSPRAGEVRDNDWRERLASSGPFDGADIVAAARRRRTADKRAATAGQPGEAAATQIGAGCSQALRLATIFLRS
jgi:hypothetical protein